MRHFDTCNYLHPKILDIRTISAQQRVANREKKIKIRATKFPKTHKKFQVIARDSYAEFWETPHLRGFYIKLPHNKFSECIRTYSDMRSYEVN